MDDSDRIKTIDELLDQMDFEDVYRVGMISQLLLMRRMMEITNTTTWNYNITLLEKQIESLNKFLDGIRTVAPVPLPRE